MRRSTLRAAFIAAMVVLASAGAHTAAVAAPPIAHCRIVDDWGTGFQAECVVTNPPPGSVDGWTVRICFAPDTVRVNQAWNVTFSMSGSPCATFTSVSYNSNLPENGT